jgi:hypothetical protein
MKPQIILLVAILVALIPSAQGAPTVLWTRHESNSATPQTIERIAGTSSIDLAFTNAIATYDFFSPPLTSSISLTTVDKAGGIIYMRNTGPVGASDFSVKGRIQYFDFNPLTGTHTLIADTGLSPQKGVNHGQLVNWPMPIVPLHVSTSLTSGHLLHVAVTVYLTAGFPGNFGFLVYNGSSGTQAQLPQNRVTTFPFGTLSPIYSPALAGSLATDGRFTIILSGAPGASCAIEATTNLSKPVWVSLITTNTDTNGWCVFKDIDSPSYPQRFYRSLSR